VLLSLNRAVGVEASFPYQIARQCVDFLPSDDPTVLKGWIESLDNLQEKLKAIDRLLK